MPRSRHRLPAPHQLLCLSTLVHSLHHRSNWVAPTWSRHRPRGLRSYKQGGPLLHHMPLTHAPCVPCAPRRPRPAPVPALLGPFGSINGCCWRWTDTWSWLDTSAPWRPRDGSTQLPRWPEAKCCQNSRERLPFSLQHHHHRHNSNKIAISTTQPWPRAGMTRWSKTKREL